MLLPDLSPCIVPYHWPAWLHEINWSSHLLYISITLHCPISLACMAARTQHELAGPTQLACMPFTSALYLYDLHVCAFPSNPNLNPNPSPDSSSDLSPPLHLSRRPLCCPCSRQGVEQLGISIGVCGMWHGLLGLRMEMKWMKWIAGPHVARIAGPQRRGKWIAGPRRRSMGDRSNKLMITGTQTRGCL